MQQPSWCQANASQPAIQPAACCLGRQGVLIRPALLLALHSCAAGARSGLLNFGYWGLYVQAGHNYTLSLYMRNPDVCPAGCLLSLVYCHCCFDSSL